MAEVPTKEVNARSAAWSRLTEVTREVQRGFIAEWTVTIVLLLFATTTLVQAFVIPSASMENTLLIGDRSEERRVGKERRCTRWNCDWSSDVCSSDLNG